MNSQLKLAAYLAGVSAAALAVDTQAEVIHESDFLSVDDGDSSTSGTDFIFIYLPDFAGLTGHDDVAGKMSHGENLEFYNIYLFPKDVNTSTGVTRPNSALGKSGEKSDPLKSIFLTLADEGEFLNGQDFSPGSSEVELIKPTDSSYLGFEWDHPELENPMHGWLEYATPSGSVELLQMAINTGPGGITVGQTSSVPEPTTLALMMAGVAGIAAARKRRGAKASR